MRSSPLAVSLVAAALGTACIQPKDDDAHPIASALPRAEDVRINLPQDGATAREAGQIAPWYLATRGVTLTLNGGTAWVLILVHTIVQFPPTRVDGDTYTWGPGSGALDPADYRLVVVDLRDGSYDWSLDGRSKTEPGADFETVISGLAFPSDPVGEGHGTFTIDFDAAERVNPIDNDARGVVSIAYDLAERTLAMHIATVEDRDGQLTAVDYDYGYAESEDGAGNMTFAVHGDSDDVGAAAEDAVLRSRWLATGEGRADLGLTGGDLGDLEVTASECWNRNFRRVYYADSVNFMPAEGDAAECAFADQDLPQ